MSKIDSLRELFLFNDWGRDRLMTAARPLSDAALDQPFDMGPGSLRKTLHHLCAVEQIWLDRWLGAAKPRFLEIRPNLPLDEVSANWIQAAQRRDQLIGEAGEAGLARLVSFTTLAGESFTFPLGELMLHVAIHGVHHRAQITNMLRRVGAELPPKGADYIFMRLDMSMATPPAPPPTLDLYTIGRCFAHADWANRPILDACAKLTDAQLDRPFEMGMNTLRATMTHILDGETWWQDNWMNGPDHLFPVLRTDMPLAEIADKYAKAAAQRNAYKSTLKDADLARIVRVQGRPGVYREFPLGVSMLQLATHGTHHRAQALNMLKHCGAELPRLDFLMLRDEAAK